MTLTPKSKQVVQGKLLGFERQVFPSLVWVKPALGICTARGVSRVHRENHEIQHTDGKAPVASANDADHSLITPCESECENAHSTPDTSFGTVLVMVENFSEKPISLPKAAVLGIAEEISESLIASIQKEDDSSPEQG